VSPSEARVRVGRDHSRPCSARYPLRARAARFLLTQTPATKLTSLPSGRPSHPSSPAGVTRGNGADVSCECARSRCAGRDTRSRSRALDAVRWYRTGDLDGISAAAVTPVRYPPVAPPSWPHHPAAWPAPRPSRAIVHSVCFWNMIYSYLDIRYIGALHDYLIMRGEG
jgi:hypothetical protein